MPALNPARLSDRLTIQDQLEQFDVAWRHGKVPRIEDFLPQADTPGRRQVWEELVKIDLEYQWRYAQQRPAPSAGAQSGVSGRGPRLEDYLARFPEFGPLEALPLELIGEEYRVRHCWGDHPSPSEYLARFAGLGAALRQRLAAIDAELALEPPRGAAAAAAGGEPGSAAPQAVAAPAAAADGAGPLIAGYDILEEVGRGGMGVVYKAWQKSLGRLVALKMLRAGERVGADVLSRFRREAAVVAQLHHPHIVQIYEVGEQDGRPFFVLEFVLEGSLDRRIRGMPQPPREAAALVEVLARAVHAVHRQGIVHRDLKPSNILVQIADGSVPAGKQDEHTPDRPAPGNLQSVIPKITDFGLAKHVDRETGTTASGAILGTPCYMAPEQASAKESGAAADIYALGAMLYELLTGRPPFWGDSPLATLMQVTSQEPGPPRRLQPTVPRDLETICLKCLEKEPKRRYASAADLADDLGRWQRGEPVRARPIGPWRRAVKWARRRPALAGLMAAVVLGLLASAAGGLWHYQQMSTALDTAEKQRDEARKNLRLAWTVTDDMLMVGRHWFRMTEGNPSFQRRQDILRRALESHEAFIRTFGDDPALRRDVIRAYLLIADIHEMLGRFGDAETALHQALDLAQRLRANQSDDSLLATQAAIHRQLRDLYLRWEKPERAAQAAQAAEQLLRDYLHWALAHRADAGSEYQLALTCLKLGEQLRQRRRPEEALSWYTQAITELEAVLNKERSDPKTTTFGLVQRKEYLRDAHVGRADTLRDLGRYADALQDWDRAIELDTGERRDYCRLHRAACLACLGNHAAAVAAVDPVTAYPLLAGNELYEAACVYSLCCPAALADTHLGLAEGKQLAEQYASRALVLLRRAVRIGWFDLPAGRRRLTTDKNLDPLRPRPDFQSFLAEVEARAKKKPSRD
jgi:tetratricopeptide (TPR) repeat protein